MDIIFNDTIKFLYKRIKYLLASSIFIYLVLGCSSESNIKNDEYQIYIEVLKYIHEFDDLKYQKFSHIILNENTVIPDDIIRYPEVKLSELKLTYLLEDCYVNLNNTDSIRKGLKIELSNKYPLMASDKIDSSTNKYITYIENKIVNKIVNEIGNLNTKFIIKDFISKNKSKNKIDKNFLFDISNCKMISSKDIDLLFNNNLLKSDWSEFFRKYPESTGILSFSRVGFNKQKTHAILYVEKICGHICGTGSYLFYYKSSGSWQVGSIFRVWSK
jgi:hypothetical protein